MTELVFDAAGDQKLTRLNLPEGQVQYDSWLNSVTVMLRLDVTPDEWSTAENSYPMGGTEDAEDAPVVITRVGGRVVAVSIDLDLM